MLFGFYWGAFSPSVKSEENMKKKKKNSKKAILRFHIERQGCLDPCEKKLCLLPLQQNAAPGGATRRSSRGKRSPLASTLSQPEEAARSEKWGRLTAPRGC